MNKKLTIFYLLILVFLLSTNNFVWASDFNLEPQVKSAIVPSDTYYENLWHLKKIKAPEAWNKTRDASKITIAIIDSGVQINHPDLKDNIWINVDEIPGNKRDDDNNGFVDDVNGWDFVNDTSDPNPKFNAGYTEEGVIHGTVVAGVVAASGNNAAGVTGVVWKAQLMPLKVLDDNGEGDTNKVVSAIDYAINNGADIINFSFVGFGYSPSLERAIKRAYDAGILIVAAAGNEQEDGQGNNLDEREMYPVCHDGPNRENWVIGVTATDSLDQKASFSSFGFKCIDLSAPGVSIFSTSLYMPDVNKDFNKYYDGYWSGTSMSAPIVSGVAALVWQINPNLNRDDVVKILLDSSDNINRLNPDYLGRLGIGRVNAERAVNLALETVLNGNPRLLISPYSGQEPVLNVADKKGIVSEKISVYANNFKGGLKASAGDVTGDKTIEIITGPGKGGGPHVIVLDQQGKMISQFFAFDERFRGGVNVAVGDIDGDSKAEIVVGAGVGGGPQIRVFDYTGKLITQFFAFDERFRGGVNVAVGDIDGDGKAEIIAGAGAGGGPQVRIFDNYGKLEGQFFAYDENFRGGVNVSTVDLDNGSKRNKKEIITTPGSGGGPHIRIFDNHGSVLGQFFAYDKNFRGGVSLTAGDIDSDGQVEIITGAGPGGSPHLKIFSKNGILKYSYFAYDADFSGGINVEFLKIN